MTVGRVVLSRRIVVAVVHVVLVVAGLGALTVARATGDASPGCDRAVQAAAERRALDTGSGAPVVVIGDSYSVGAGVAPLDSWPTRLPGRVHVDGFSGSGFSAGASGCGPVSYAERATRAVAGRPGALVVVEGGLNDHDQSDEAITTGFRQLTARLAGHDVLVVGPPPAPDRAAGVPRVDSLLASLSASAGLTYLSLAEADIEYLTDDLHPTAAGHRTFGDLVAAEVSRLVG